MNSYTTNSYTITPGTKIWGTTETYGTSYYTGTSYTYPPYTTGTGSTTTIDIEKHMAEAYLKKERELTSVDKDTIKITNEEYIILKRILGKEPEKCSMDEIKEQLLLLRI